MAGLPPLEQKLYRQVYLVLCLQVSGVAMTKLQNVEAHNGLEAWRQLVLEFEPRTAGQTRLHLTSLLRPAKTNNMEKLSETIEQWGEKSVTTSSVTSGCTSVAWTRRSRLVSLRTWCPRRSGSISFCLLTNYRRMLMREQTELQVTTGLQRGKEGQTPRSVTTRKAIETGTVGHPPNAPLRRRSTRLVGRAATRGLTSHG
eukprot:194261-Amphidinium_carterae.1